MLEKHKMNRINELAKKQKSEGLEEHEKKEQHSLRQEYLVRFREHFKGQLDNIEIVDEPVGDSSAVDAPAAENTNKQEAIKE